ncbi:MAG: DUF523 domain-containing protein [Desulfobulbaceae bacterium]|nr:DUF523 domain-containing protein [Desulfobulbaceae bacterium]
MPHVPPIILVSACLVGIACRYDGKIKTNPDCRQEIDRLGAIWIPFCPEQLGGLSTPREAADIVDGDGNDVLSGQARVINRNGVDVTNAFCLGAEQVLAIAGQQAVCAVFLKARSPSCAVSSPMGVTAAILARHGYQLREF